MTGQRSFSFKKKGFKKDAIRLSARCILMGQEAGHAINGI